MKYAFLSVLCALFLSVGVTPSLSHASTIASINELKDVVPTNTNYEAIKSLAEQWGVIENYPDGMFKPNRSLTHAELAIFLNNSLNKLKKLATEEKSKLKTPMGGNESRIKKLTDVSKTANYYPAIVSLNSNYGIVIKNKQNQFEPNATITYEQLYNILNTIFHYNKTIFAGKANQMVTKGDFCSELNNALNEATVNLFQK